MTTGHSQHSRRPVHTLISIPCRFGVLTPQSRDFGSRKRLVGLFSRRETARNASNLSENLTDSDYNVVLDSAWYDEHIDAT